MVCNSLNMKKNPYFISVYHENAVLKKKGNISIYMIYLIGLIRGNFQTFFQLCFPLFTSFI